MAWIQLPKEEMGAMSRAARKVRTSGGGAGRPGDIDLVVPLEGVTGGDWPPDLLAAAPEDLGEEAAGEAPVDRPGRIAELPDLEERDC